MAYSPDGKRIVTGSVDKTAKVWDAEHEPGASHSQGPHGRASWSVAFSPDGKRIVTGSKTGRRRCGTPDRARRSSPSRDTQTRCVSVAFSPDGKRIVTGEPCPTGAG